MKFRILIVDDQEVLRRLVKMTLAAPEFEFDEAVTGDQALEKLKKFQPDLVVLDVMMPGSHSGYEVCNIIKNTPNYEATKVILLTARGQQVDLDEGNRVGADAYMVKPFSPMELVEKVRTLLG